MELFHGIIGAYFTVLTVGTIIFYSIDKFFDKRKIKNATK